MRDDIPAVTRVRLWPLARCVRSWRCSSSVVQSPSEMVRSSCWAPSCARSFRLDASRVARVSFKVCLASHLADEALQPHGEVMPGVRVLPPLGLPAKPQVRAPILKRPAWFNHDSHAEYPAVSRAGWSVGSARKVARVEGGCTHLLPVPRASKLRVDEGTSEKALRAVLDTTGSSTCPSPFYVLPSARASSTATEMLPNLRHKVA